MISEEAATAPRVPSETDGATINRDLTIGSCPLNSQYVLCDHLKAIILPSTAQ